ncbi:MAG: hypothetical protein NT069_23250 [Planctomycetota bacterium]|nr:hypothetical protein [Planctomycetota bacterium]
MRESLHNCIAQQDDLRGGRINVVETSTSLLFTNVGGGCRERTIDQRYTRMFMGRTDLDLLDVIGLDKVQKGKPISEDEFRSLKAKKLIEGRRPNLVVSAEIAAVTETVVDELLLAKLLDALDDDQRRNLITNLLQDVRRNRVVEVHGKGPGAIWELYKPASSDED